jgi:hypothetical protein
VPHGRAVDGPRSSFQSRLDRVAIDCFLVGVPREPLAKGTWSTLRTGLTGSTVTSVIALTQGGCEFGATPPTRQVQRCTAPLRRPDPPVGYVALREGVGRTAINAYAVAAPYRQSESWLRWRRLGVKGRLTILPTR